MNLAPQDTNNEGSGYSKKITGVDYLRPKLEKALLNKSEELGMMAETVVKICYTSTYTLGDGVCDDDNNQS